MFTKKILGQKFSVTFIILILLILISTLVKAEDHSTQRLESQLIEYDINTIGLKISIPSELTDLIKALQNNDERLEKYENKEEYLQAYKQSGILADFVDKLEEEPNTEIVISAKTSSSYANMPNFNTLTEEDMNEYTNRFVATIKQQNEQKTEQGQQTGNQTNEQSNNVTEEQENSKTQLTVNDGTLIKTENGNCFIKIISTAIQEDNSIDIHMYYTIMNGRLITISFRNYKDVNNDEMEKTILQNIQFYEIERPQYVTASDQARLATGIATIMVIILLIIVFFIRRKDNKMLNKNIKDVIIKQYSKFGGLLVFFWSLCFYQVLLRVIDISDVSALEGLGFYKNAIILQSSVVGLISMYQIYITVKRQQETPKKIVRSNIVMLTISSSITLARIVYALIKPMEYYTNTYFKQEFSVLMTNILYPLVWNIYFTFSKRVQIYYYLPIKTYKETIKQTKIYEKIFSRFSKIRKGKNNEGESKKHN